MTDIENELGVKRIAGIQRDLYVVWCLTTYGSDRIDYGYELHLSLSPQSTNQVSLARKTIGFQIYVYQMIQRQASH